MRISDWSSDVCSSDLVSPTIADPDEILTIAPFVSSRWGSAAFVAIKIDRRLDAIDLSKVDISVYNNVPSNVVSDVSGQLFTHTAHRPYLLTAFWILASTDRTSTV